MCCSWNRLFAGVFVCCTSVLVTGCYNMNGYVMNASGHGYYDQGNYAMAAREFETALQSNPYNADYMANLAKAKAKMGDQQTAEQMFRQALATTPSHQPSYHGLAELMIAQGRGEEANRLVNTWASTQPYVAESHVELAWVQKELGQSHAAAQSLQRALQVNPSHSTALAHLGQYYQEIGQPSQAVAMYQQSLQSDWNQPEVHSQIASAAQAAGPNHPMGEMAMARGVHPESLARKQLAFGPGMVSGRAMVGGPGMPGQQLAFQPPHNPQFAANSATMAAGGYPGMMAQQPHAYSPPPPGSQFTPQIMAGANPPSPANQSAFMPGQAFNPMMPFPVGGGDVTTSVATSPSSTPVQLTTPTPDPAFSVAETQNPFQAVSNSTTIASDIPEVIAF